jgi:predicted phosphodiesterase
VHGNLPAFEKMLEKEKECEQFICLGDLVNYGPWSNECVALALNLKNIKLIKGNHESYFISGIYPGKSQLVQDFFQISKNNFKYKNEITAFEDHLNFEQFTCQHTINDQYIFQDSTLILDKNYIIGHSHQQFKLCNNSFELYNTGSVGQNRSYINEINYLLYDSETHEMELKSLLFNIDLILSKMKEMNYPEQCIAYYATKKLK